MRRPLDRLSTRKLMLVVAVIALTIATASYFDTTFRLLEGSLFNFVRARRWLTEVPHLRAIGANDVADERVSVAGDADRHLLWCLWYAAPALALMGAAGLYGCSRLAVRLIPRLRSRRTHDRPGLFARVVRASAAVVLLAVVLSAVARLARAYYPTSPPRVQMILRDGRLEAVEEGRPEAVPREPDVIELEPVTPADSLPAPTRPE
jgi:hypothetical protein